MCKNDYMHLYMCIEFSVVLWQELSLGVYSLCTVKTKKQAGSIPKDITIMMGDIREKSVKERITLEKQREQLY